MPSKYICVGLHAVLLYAASAQGQEPQVQALERRLQERDKVILELLERVETLERRAGVVRRPQESVPGAAREAGAAERAGSAPGAVNVEEGAAERALERALTLQGALLLPAGVLEVEPSLRYVRQEDVAPRFVTSGGQVFAGETERNTGALTGNLALRLGLPLDSQLEVGIPYQWREVESVTNVGFAPTASSTRSGAGAGDVRLGLAKTLLRESTGRPDVVGRIVWDTDTGRTAESGVSLGGGFHEIRGSLTAIKRQDPLVFVGGFSYEYPLEEDGIQPGPTLSANFGSFIALSPETSLRIALAGAYQDETELSGREVAGSDRTIGTFVVGASTLLGPGTLLSLSAGIGLTDDADDFSITLSLPVRFGERLF